MADLVEKRVLKQPFNEESPSLEERIANVVGLNRDYGAAMGRMDATTPIQDFNPALLAVADLKRILPPLIRALRALQLPQPYFGLIDKIHEQAYAAFAKTKIAQELLPSWKKEIFPMLSKSEENTLTDQTRQALDNAGITPEKSIVLMNAASAAVQNAWKKIALEDFGLAVSADPARYGLDTTSANADVSRTKESEAGGSFSAFSDRAAIMLDFRQIVSESFNKAQYHIQSQIRRLCEDKDIREGLKKSGKGWLTDADTMISYAAHYGISEFPLHVPFRPVEPGDLGDLAWQKYLSSPFKIAGMYQAALAEAAFSEEHGLPLRAHVQREKKASPGY